MVNSGHLCRLQRCRHHTILADLPTPTYSPDHLLYPATRHNEMVNIDIVGPFKRSASGNKYILTVMDRFSRFVMAIPLPNIRASTVIMYFLRWLSIFGPPKMLLSDNGSQFTSKCWELLMNTIGSRHKRTTPYKPSTNGMIERFHRYLKERLALIGIDLELDFTLKGADWDLFLPHICYIYNTTPTAATNQSPATIVLGYQPDLPMDVQIEKLLPSQNKEFIQYMKTIKELSIGRALDWQSKYDEIRKTQRDKDRKSVQYKEGDIVLFNIKNKLKTKLKKALQPSWSGPFEIIRVWNNGLNYSLRHIKEGYEIPVCHITNIKKYKGDITKMTHHPLRHDDDYKDPVINDERHNDNDERVDQLLGIEPVEQKMDVDDDVKLFYDQDNVPPEYFTWTKTSHTIGRVLHDEIYNLSFQDEEVDNFHSHLQWNNNKNKPIEFMDSIHNNSQMEFSHNDLDYSQQLLQQQTHYQLINRFQPTYEIFYPKLKQ